MKQQKKQSSNSIQTMDGKKYYVYLLTFLMVTMLNLCFISCGGDDDEGSKTSAKATPLPQMRNVSLSYRSSVETITLARDVQAEGATVSLKKGVSWINNIQLSGKIISFDVEENTGTSSGYRFDTLVVEVNSTRIGAICVTQARNPFSDSRLVWANEKALYRKTALSSSDLSGLEMTKLVFNLEKATGGKDSYKNYPAFAFCIEMNHDPENNMEWYLPSENEIRSYAYAQSYSGTPIAKHNYWWSSSENYIDGNAYNVYSGSIASRGAVYKGQDWWVVAFRNGKIEE